MSVRALPTGRTQHSTCRSTMQRLSNRYFLKKSYSLADPGPGFTKRGIENLENGLESRSIKSKAMAVAQNQITPFCQ